MKRQGGRWTEGVIDGETETDEETGKETERQRLMKRQGGRGRDRLLRQGGRGRDRDC